ncbi:MAG TPA: ABC transporter permease [Candidatus Methylomirabilis sp.]|nr:ABC transporter permease [Candidatus Methylomirabilis sp.]
MRGLATMAVEAATGEGQGAAARALRRVLSVRWVLYVAGPITMLGAWQYASDAFATKQLFPGPSETFRAFARLVASKQLALDTLASLRRIGLGFAIGSISGFLVGLTAGYVPLVRHLLYPYIHFLRFISAIAWLSMALLWFGTGETGKVALITYTTTFVVMVNVMAGVASIPVNRLRSARCFGATEWQIFAQVVLPSTLGYFFDGARLAMANSFATVVTAEMLAAQSGLGYLILVSRQWLAVDEIFVGIIVLGILGWLTDRVLVSLTDNRFRRHRLRS